MNSLGIKLNIAALSFFIFLGFSSLALAAADSKTESEPAAEPAASLRENTQAAAPAQERQPAEAAESARNNDQAAADNAASAVETAAPEQAVYPGAQNLLYESGKSDEPHASIWYPSFGNAAVDSQIKYFVAVQGADFSKDVSDSAPEGEEKPVSYDQWELTGFYTLNRPNPDIVSITFNIYSYTGGAHGNLFIRCLNYDLKNGKELGLGDIFGDKEKALEILSAYTEKKLREELGGETDEDMLKAGTSLDEINFLNLSLNKNGLTVEFQPYQVGPWSIGPQSVAVPLAELEPAKPSSVIWPAASKKME